MLNLVNFNFWMGIVNKDLFDVIFYIEIGFVNRYYIKEQLRHQMRGGQHQISGWEMLWKSNW